MKFLHLKGEFHGNAARLVQLAQRAQPVMTAVVLSALCLLTSDLVVAAHVPNRILIKFKPGTSTVQKAQALAAHRGKTEKVLETIDVHVVAVAAAANEEQLVEVLRQRPEVEFAELDDILPPQATVPNDTWFPNEIYMPWIKATDAWDLTTGTIGQPLTVAVLDTGIFGTHPDLMPKMVAGWNIFNNNSATNDLNGHGTWSAGVIAPATNNGGGVAGVCWGCKLMPIRVSDDNGNATESDIAAGLTYASSHGAKVANVGFAISGSPTVRAAALAFWCRGATTGTNGPCPGGNTPAPSGGLTVVPAGNFGTFDASPDNPYIVTVGGTDPWSDTIWSQSNTGNNIDLTAPNFSNITTSLTGYSADNSGTSISAAIVSGIAALVWSINSTLTPEGVTQILKQSADDKGPAGWDTTYGWGRANAFKAVQMARAGTSVPCDLNGDNTTNVIDVQQSVNQALGSSSCAADLNKDGACNVLDVQRITNAALGGPCVAN